MDLGIRGRRAILAGASAGMGRAAARALAAEGVELVIGARGAERLQATARAIAEETGASVTAVPGDHATPEGRARLVEACPEPDILVITCSPPAAAASYRDLTPADWMASVETTMLAPIELMRATLDGMAARGFGRVVNIATVAAKTPTELRLLSGPSRSALVNYTVAVSKVVAGRGVVINTLLPGMVHTEGMGETLRARAAEKGVTEAEEAAAYAKRLRIPAGALGDPEDVGALCAMLCSRQAGYLVGQSLVVDGGLTNSLF